MSELRDKLAALGRGITARQDPSESAERGAVAPPTSRATALASGREARPADVPVAEVLDASEQMCPSGSVLVRTVRVPCGAAWGVGCIELPRLGTVLRGYVGGGLDRLRDPARTVFLDTETTGLAGGSGTYAFLIGIGRFAEDAFVLRQLFLRGPWEERALLEVASLLLEGAEAVVSYNGKSFDVPLLRGRLAFHGLPDPLRRTPHVDLLHIARRLWRQRLPACGLGDVERGALRVGRDQQDVPGHLIPELYFGFLRSGDASALRGVMYHNERDVCSLAALLGHVDDLLEGRMDARRMPLEDLLSLARTREALGDGAEAFSLLEVAAERLHDDESSSPAMAAEAFLRAGRLAKRVGELARARSYFDRAANLPLEGAGPVEAIVELAKLLEHQERTLDAALGCVDAGLAAVGHVREPHERARLRDDLAYRRARILRKLDVAQARARASRQAASS